MGWWSHRIMGGDAPLDALNDLAAALGVAWGGTAEGSWHGYALGGVAPESMPGPVLAQALGVVSDDPDYRGPVAAQVAALLLMRYGAPISAPDRMRLLDAMARDEWAAEERRSGGGQRGPEVAALMALLVAYDGTPVDGDLDEGLLAKIEAAYSAARG